MMNANDGNGDDGDDDDEKVNLGGKRWAGSKLIKDNDDGNDDEC